MAIAVNVFEAPREAGVILQGLELRFGERVVIADLGAAQRAGDPEVGEELGGTLAGHRRAAVRMQGHLGLDALLETGFLDQRRGERGVLPIGTIQPTTQRLKMSSKTWRWVVQRLGKPGG